MIRPLTAADAAAAAKIAFASMPQPWSEAAFVKEAVNSAFLLLGAFADADGTGGDDDGQDVSGIEDPSGTCGDASGALLGFIILALTPDDAELTGIAVDAAFRRQGIAGALLQAAREALSARDIDRIVLEVRASNAPAIAFYEKHEFTCIGVRRDFYEDPREDALVMTDQKE